MQKPFAFISFFIYSVAFTQDSFQLAKPLVKYKSVFFKDSAKLELKFAQSGAKIYYAIDNTMHHENPGDPSEKSLLYKKPIIIKKQFSTVKVKVFSKGFIPSETVEYSFAREGKKIKRITATTPDTKYPGTGDNTLFDNKGGIGDLNSKTWMGFYTDSINFVIELTKKETTSSILLSFLQNEDSWVFLPELILVYYFDENKKEFLPFGREVLFHERKSPPGVDFRFIVPKNENIKTQQLMINIRSVKKIPEWHEAKGQPAWCFIDEIKVY